MWNAWVHRTILLLLLFAKKVGKLIYAKKITTRVGMAIKIVMIPTVPQYHTVIIKEMYSNFIV